MIHLTLGLLISGALAAPSDTDADAGPWTVAEGFVLSPTKGHFTETWGISAPTVAYDGTQYVMFFENKMDEEPEDTCKSGYHIGRAISPDGITWTLDPDPVLEPVPNSYYACVLSQPAVLFDGSLWHLWFAAGQYKDPCPEDTGGGSATEPAWGCETQTGLGYATSSDGLSWTVTPEPILNRTNLGHPTALVKDDTIEVLFTDADSEAGSINLLSSGDGGSTWTEVGAVVEPGLNDWMDDRLSGAAGTCDLDESLPYELFFTGKNVDGDNGFGKVVSTDLASWFFEAESSPYFTEGDAGTPWEADNWAHWEVLATENGSDVLWFAIKDTTDDVRKIGMAYTDASWDTPLSRVCVEDVEPTDTELSETETDTETPSATDTDEPSATDTDAPTETDEPTASDTDSASDTDDTGGEEDCGCNAATAAPAALWGFAMLLPLVLRRRR